MNKEQLREALKNAAQQPTTHPQPPMHAPLVVPHPQHKGVASLADMQGGYAMPRRATSPSSLVAANAPPSKQARLAGYQDMQRGTNSPQQAYAMYSNARAYPPAARVPPGYMRPPPYMMNPAVAHQQGEMPPMGVPMGAMPRTPMQQQHMMAAQSKKLRPYGTNALVNPSALGRRMRLSLDREAVLRRVQIDPSAEAVLSQAIVIRLKQVLTAVSAAAQYRTNTTYNAAVKANRAKFRVTSDPQAQLEAFERRCAQNYGADTAAAADSVTADGMPAEIKTVAPPPPLKPGMAQMMAQHSSFVIGPEDFFAQREVVGNQVLDTYRITALNRLQY